jgi:hypothetical protein
MKVYIVTDTMGTQQIFDSTSKAILAVCRDAGECHALTDADGKSLINTLDEQIEKIEHWMNRQFYSWSEGGYETGEQLGSWHISVHEVL